MTTARNTKPRGNVINGTHRILDLPRFRVARTTAQSPTNGVITQVIFDNAVAITDTDGMFDPNRNLARVYCVTAGTYDVKLSVYWEVAGGGAGTQRDAWISKNGGTFRYAFNSRTPSASIYVDNHASDQIELDAGDTLEIQVYHDGGATGTSTGGGLFNASELSGCLSSL